MRLYALSGDRAAALDQYRECVRTLSRELGVPPLEETTRLYEAISEGTLAAPDAARRPEPAAAARGGAARRPRRGPARAARRVRAVGPDGAVVVLEGEAGIGKTRLAEELLARARAAPSLAGRGYEEESALAYGPIVEALRGRLRERRRLARRRRRRALAEAARLVARAGRGPAGPAGAGAARRARAPRPASSRACGTRSRRRGPAPACCSSTTSSGPTRPRSACSPTGCAGWPAARCWSC